MIERPYLVDRFGRRMDRALARRVARYRLTGRPFPAAGQPDPAADLSDEQIVELATDAAGSFNWGWRD